MFLNPLEQFSIITLIKILGAPFVNNYYSFTNAHYFFFIALFFFFFFYNVLNYKINKIFINFIYFYNIVYVFILQTLIDNVKKQYSIYFKWIIITFIFILICNVVGLVPYSFTLTSHIIITFWLAFGLILGINYILISRYGLETAKLFYPPGAPFILLPLLIVIEILSHIIKVISLSVRLFANMMSGHILLKVLLGFAWVMLFKNIYMFFISFIPTSIVFILLGLESAIAGIQAYVFIMLLCIYLTEAIYLH